MKSDSTRGVGGGSKGCARVCVLRLRMCLGRYVSNVGEANGAWAKNITRESSSNSNRATTQVHANTRPCFTSFIPEGAKNDGPGNRPSLN